MSRKTLRSVLGAGILIGVPEGITMKLAPIIRWLYLAAVTLLALSLPGTVAGAGGPLTSGRRRAAPGFRKESVRETITPVGSKPMALCRAGATTASAKRHLLAASSLR